VLSPSSGLKHIVSIFKAENTVSVFSHEDGSRSVCPKLRHLPVSVDGTEMRRRHHHHHHHHEG
jgi:hypothetical protein